MASIQIEGGRLHSAGEAKAQFRHSCTDERLVHTHSNEDIDKTLTSTNTDLHGLSYADMCKAYDDRIQYHIDKLKSEGKRSMRSDAVTMLDIVIPVPEGLSDVKPDPDPEHPDIIPVSEVDRWYQDVEKVINEHYGSKVVLDIKIHRDEIHEYRDPSTKEMTKSRIHGHCFCFPEVDGRLNCKKFTSRKDLISLNKEIDDMTHQNYERGFMTGKKAVGRGFKSVEELKQDSDYMERYISNTQSIQESEKATQEAERWAQEAQAQAQEAARALEQAQYDLRCAEATALDYLEQAQQSSARIKRHKAQIEALTAEREKIQSEVENLKQGHIDPKVIGNLKDVIDTIDSAAKNAGEIDRRISYEDLTLKKPLFGGDHEVTLGSVQHASYQLKKDIEDLKPVADNLAKACGKIDKILTDIQGTIESRVQKVVKSMHAKTVEDMNVARRTRSESETLKSKYEGLVAKYKSMCDDQDKLIMQQAKTVKNHELDRLKDFCKGITYKDGTSVLDRFNQAERSRNRGMER